MAQPIDKNIEDHSGYYDTTIKNAEFVLQNEGENCHLLRYNQKEQKYILSVVWNGHIKHFHLITSIIHANSMYEIEGAGRKFKDVHKLLKFYKTYPLDKCIQGIGYTLDRNKSTSIKRKKTFTQSLKSHIFHNEKPVCHMSTQTGSLTQLTDYSQLTDYPRNSPPLSYCTNVTTRRSTNHDGHEHVSGASDYVDQNPSGYDQMRTNGSHNQHQPLPTDDQCKVFA